MIFLLLCDLSLALTDENHKISPHQLTFMSALPHQSFRASPSTLLYCAYVTIRRQTMCKLHTKSFITPTLRFFRQALRYKEPISIPIANVSHPGRKRTVSPDH
ncbi:hypothetical protein CEXT_547571 [Caerostris extrusa]|uniref:Secreted protein n=1 Tax=Caerostris extrusa TaxID=172846 RepID=A0AAV4XLM9_CAEEX|nr:hypothetical protein CEXT_547571 [Caerostris extrusa]